MRLDSGDVAMLSRDVRAILDEDGMAATRILASGDLDEWVIEGWVSTGARSPGSASGPGW